MLIINKKLLPFPFLDSSLYVMIWLFFFIFLRTDIREISAYLGVFWSWWWNRTRMSHILIRIQIPGCRTLFPKLLILYQEFVPFSGSPTFPRSWLFIKSHENWFMKIRRSGVKQYGNSYHNNNNNNNNINNNNNTNNNNMRLLHIPWCGVYNTCISLYSYMQCVFFFIELKVFVNLTCLYL